MKRALSILFLICLTSFSEEKSWYVVLDMLYIENDQSIHRQLKGLQKDSLNLSSMHGCDDLESREYFVPLDTSILSGVYRGEPEAYYSTDTLPAVHYTLWVSIKDSAVAHLVSERYQGSIKKDITGNGPGLPGEWNIALPQVFTHSHAAMNFIKKLDAELGTTAMGYALLTKGEYLFFGSCLSKELADSLVILLRKRGVSTKALQITYQHIDI